MTTITGASQYLNAATLANLQGQAAQSPTLLDGLGFDLGAIGKRINNSGIGVSSAARQLNQQLLNNSDFTTLLSLAAGTDATVEGMQQQIQALRSTLPISKLDSSVIEGGDNGQVSVSENGQEVDTEA